MVRLVSLGEGGGSWVRLSEAGLGWVTVRLVEVEMSGSK